MTAIAYERGWFRLTDMGDGTYRVDDDSGTVKALTFGRLDLAVLAVDDLDDAADYGKVEQERAYWLPIARRSLGQEPDDA